MIDQRISFARGVPSCDIGCAHFEFKSTGDAVARLEGIRFRILPVLVQIDEAGSDDETFRIDSCPAAQGLRRNRTDFISVDSDPSDCVKTCFGIDHPTVGDDKVVRLGTKRGSEDEEEKEPHGP